MTVALRGAVIAREQGGQLEYRLKCDSCGQIEPRSLQTATLPKNIRSTNSFYCSNCEKSQEVELVG
jgi:transcription elongation factor Elf1